MKLVIVESPAKSKTIGHYLGSDYDVEASVGHVRDLAIQGKEGLGIDISNDFKPTYVVNKDKTAVVKSLKAKAKKLMKFYLQPTLIEKEKLLLGIWLKFYLYRLKKLKDLSSMKLLKNLF